MQKKVRFGIGGGAQIVALGLAVAVQQLGMAESLVLGGVVSLVGIVIMVWPLLARLRFRSPLTLAPAPESFGRDSANGRSAGQGFDSGPLAGTGEVAYQGDKLALPLNLDSLGEPFARHTRKDLKSYVESKIDCWFPVSGLILNVIEHVDIVGNLSGYLVTIETRLDQLGVLCSFGGDQAASVRPLEKSDEISLIGQIKYIDESYVKLDNCVRLNKNGLEVTAKGESPNG